MESQNIVSAKFWTSYLVENLNSFRRAVEVLSKVAFIGWSIWRMRNDAIFQSTLPNPAVALKRAQFGWKEFNSQLSFRNRQFLPPSLNHPVLCWRRPPTSLVKANCDAAFDE
ncbi:unnamed protein product [Ilex paraguariensis]|uniref:Uncharacterized protein n=1 Tax=Ilex paraguariensis TaxID=185542 RepID=A0ABC8RYI5_9AQUA